MSSIQIVNSSGSTPVVDFDGSISSAQRKPGLARTAYYTTLNYLNVLKLRETSLIAFIGICTAVLSGSGHPQFDRLGIISLALLLSSAGANGLTNYLDRHFDARMERTKDRVLPSKRIYPAEKVLPLTLGLIIVGLALAWYLHPFCFMAGAGGTVAAFVWRKRSICVFPQGVLASCAPILAAWFAINSAPSWLMLSICLLIAIWIPLHLWSIILFWRDDYIRAGIKFFPLNLRIEQAAKILAVLSILLYAASIAVYFADNFTWIYMLLANLLGSTLVYTSLRLVTSTSSKHFWNIYKLSAFPYLGLLFMAMCLDTWIRSGL